MPRFNLEVRTNDRVMQSIPAQAEDHEGLRIETARLIGALLKDHAELIWVDENWRIDGTDEKGLILFSIHVFATDTPATMYQRRS